MKKLFLVEILIVLLISCTTNSVSVNSALTPLESKDDTLLALYKAYDSNPDDKSTSYNLAFALASEKKYDEALEIINKALKIHPEIVRFYTLKAFIHKSKFDFREYEKTYEKLLELDSAHTAVALELMNHYDSLFEHEKAKQMAKLVLKYEKDNEDALRILYSDDEVLSVLTKEKENKTSPYKYEIPQIPDLSSISFNPLPL